MQHKTLAGENFGGFGRFPVNRQSFIHQILGFQNPYSSNRQNFIRQLFHIIESAKVFSRQSFVLYGSIIYQR